MPNQDYGQGTETGEGVWVALETPSDPTTFGLYEAGVAAGMTGYYRPEDMARDPKSDGVRVCWNDTGNDGDSHWGETMCMVDEPAEETTADPAGTIPVVSRFIEGNPEMRMPDNIDFDPANLATCGSTSTPPRAAPTIRPIPTTTSGSACPTATMSIPSPMDARAL